LFEIDVLLNQNRYLFDPTVAEECIGFIELIDVSLDVVKDIVRSEFPIFSLLKNL
jgi:hypothetical protein